jgi:hypothetical protein
VGPVNDVQVRADVSVHRFFPLPQDPFPFPARSFYYGGDESVIEMIAQPAFPGSIVYIFIFHYSLTGGKLLKIKIKIKNLHASSIL